MVAPCSTLARLVKILLCAIIFGAGCALAGCASSQHATGDTTYTRVDDQVLVEVLLNEDKIHMPTTIPGGDVVFQIKNIGTHEHNFKIAGQGVEAAPPHNLKPGESTELRVQLKPGTYKVTCPVGPHASLGMRLELTVTE